MATVKNMPPFAAPDAIKCPMVTKFATGTDYVNAFINGLASGLADQLCVGECAVIRKVYKQSMAYGADLAHYLELLAEDDPPDNAFQQIPTPAPPPVLAAPSGLSDAQLNSFLNLEQTLATAIGDVGAMRTAVYRMWGAGNADDDYWYHRQAATLATLTGEAETALTALPAAYAAVEAAFAGDIPALSVDESTIADFEGQLSSGLPADIATTLGQLGVSAADQQLMATDMAGVDESGLARGPVTDLFAPPADFAGDAQQLIGYQGWAAGLGSDTPPVVTGLDESTTPTAGGGTLTIYGANLQDATGISFGESAPDHNLGTNLQCDYAQCTTTVPPGSGTVDVTVDGPGGPSARTTADRLTYTEPASPVVSRIFPATGSITGGDSVQVFGSGLIDAAIYFGPTLADDWSCTDKLCTATAPASAQATTVDVQAVIPGGTSPPTAGDRFTYSATEPPPPPVPTVTGVSPASTNVHGGNTITITGSGFTDASDVSFYKDGVQWGDIDDFTVVDDSHITFPAPSDVPETVDTVVTTPAGSSATSTADRLTFTEGNPTITGVSPASGPTTGGTPVTITGSNLNDSDFAFGDADQPTGVSCAPTRCTMTTGPGPAGLVDVRSSSDDDSSTSTLSAADHFTYVKAGAPTATRIAPDAVSVSGGTPIAIIGTNLGGGTVTIGGQPAGTDTEGVYGEPCQGTSCLVAAPAGGPGTQPIVVTRPDGVSATVGTIDYVTPGAPVVTDVEPHSTWLTGARSLVVVGRNLEDGSINIGGNTYTQQDGVDCSPQTCTLTETGGGAAGIVDVTVHTPVGISATSAADKFTFYLPAITSVSPSSGFTAGGAAVTIEGSHLTDSEIFFGDAEADGMSCTDTECTGPAPEVDGFGRQRRGRHRRCHRLVARHASDGDGVIDPTISATTAADRFTYTREPAPVITAVTPDTGTDEGGDQITVTGNYLVGGTVNFYGDRVTSSCTQTRCTAVTPTSFDETAQDDPVTVTTANGTSAAIQFHYLAPGKPTITAVSPASGGAGGGTAVAISGTNLTNATITFGPTPAADVTCTATTCSAESPAASVGVVDVRAGTDGGTSATSAADHFAYTMPPAPTVTAISPALGPTTGGTLLTVTGTALTGGVVHLGSAATGDSVCTATSCTVTQPAAAPGTLDVTVVTAGGTSPTTTADRFIVSLIGVHEVPIPDVDADTASGGGHVIGAPDGSVWFTMPDLEEVGRVAPDDSITTYPDVPTADGTPALPVGIAVTADGTAWYTEENANRIVSVTADGIQHTYQLPGNSPDIRQLVAGPGRPPLVHPRHLWRYRRHDHLGRGDNLSAARRVQLPGQPGRRPGRPAVVHRSRRRRNRRHHHRRGGQRIPTRRGGRRAVGHRGRSGRPAVVHRTRRTRPGSDHHRRRYDDLSLAQRCPDDRYLVGPRRPTVVHAHRHRRDQRLRSRDRYRFRLPTARPRRDGRAELPRPRK